MSLSLAENVIVVRADNLPLMLDKTNYSSWESRMLLYIKRKTNGKLIVDSLLNGPFQYGTILEPETETTLGIVIARTYTDLTDEEKLRESVDIMVINIVLQDNEDTVILAQLSQEIPTPAVFQTDDFDAFYSDYDDVPFAKAVLMENLSSYDSNILS
nr:hypothetical protein [Tanacetum cinerariifolium]GFA54497.1 hypothetical protein [Tanacetum cinerariifolium]